MKISVIIPIYNVEKYIILCLESLVNQTMKDCVECILVDDCGNDNSIHIIEEFIDCYTGIIHFHLTHHEHNRGLSAARNTGIAAAKGKYLCFLDSDDELTPDAIEKMYSLAEAHNADMVQGCYEASVPMLTNFWKNLPEFTDDNSYIKRTMLDYDHYPVMAQNRLLRRDIIVENKVYFKEGIIHEDNHWTFFLAKHINRLAVCSTPTYIYRSNPDSITAVKNLHKESLAFKTFITDFCHNIDPFECGAQKRLIFLNILSMWRGKLYESKSEALELISLFMGKNTIIERMLLWLSLYFMPKTFINNKVVNLLQRVYMSKL